ncbi:hypothetical protein [Lactobacillus sp. ESL0228]|uniref:hypothetical protein n=1 Tax=Lactobacillus sp. ESL0228 TaxID=2069352 RepID=UPI000EFD8CD9|nr:hypothetical protein [Lactobacillus sp. ESL0228]RMC48892.1 hypothetical protein F5ESL0228_04650 [Lactobacillus sp. ESL0228]
MWHKLISNINKNFNQVVIGLSIVLIGGFLFADKNYFTWPPQLRPMMNSEYSDIFFIILGLVLLYCAVTGNKNKVIHDITITVAGGATFVLLTEQLWHVLFAHNIEMTMAVIFDAVLFILIIRCAYTS